MKQIIKAWLICLLAGMCMGLAARPQSLPTQWHFLRGMRLYQYR